MPVTVLPHDPSWVNAFTHIKAELEAALAGVSFIAIEHVGSTSIPELPAKPILDIDVVATQEQLRPVIEALQHPDLQLMYMGELGIANRHAFRAPQKLPVRNLYVCIEGSAALRNHLAVRDLLRGDEKLRREYGELKSGLAARGMEIHEYMTAKGAFMLRMLRMSDQLTDAEIEDIRKATSSATRMAPIKLENLVMREFVIGDVDGLLQANLVSTIKEAEALTVEIIRDAGMVKRKRAELAILLPINQEGNEDELMVGRVGVRIVDDVNTIGADRSLKRLFDAWPAKMMHKRRLHLLYVFSSQFENDVTIGMKALPAFIEAFAQMEKKDARDDDIATDSDSETVWHLLKGREIPLPRIDDGTLKGSMVFWLNNPS